ncbi:MAG: PKD domain-containing protein [Candidatus Omnitrophica bacterium]|nr:PKD domain-containing protein [Candidatus Omnitrophota bacterium]
MIQLRQAVVTTMFCASTAMAAQPLWAAQGPDAAMESAMRQQAIERAIAAASTTKRKPASTTTATRKTSPAKKSPARASDKGRQTSAPIPDQVVNGVKWFYIFGSHGKTDYGARPDNLEVFVEVPRSFGAPISLRVFDADIKGKRDEMAGGWNTITRFSVYGAGSKALASYTIGPEAADGTTLEFGPFPLEMGDTQGDNAVFRFEAQGLAGDDNNVFSLDVLPPGVEAYALSPSIRLAEQADETLATAFPRMPGKPEATMEFFPAVPEGSTCVVESNYDVDPDGARLSLISPTGKCYPIKSSGSEAWVSTQVPVLEGEGGRRWIYRMTKVTQRKGNAGFEFKDQSGQPLRIYFTKGAGAPPAPSTAAPKVTPISSCNTFEFDGSRSSDPDGNRLTYTWDFGDGTTTEGVRVPHTFAKAGDYRVTLTVDDGTSTTCCEDKTEQIVHVNTPPKAVFSAPPRACVGAPVSLSAMQSSDTPGEALTYRWDFGDGTVAEGMTASHSYTKGGTYRIKLLADDGQHTACSTNEMVQVILVNSPPVAKAQQTATACAYHGNQPLDVKFSGAGSADPDGNALSYRWDFGDKSQAGEGAQTSHVYQKGGKYTATLTVDDGLGSACSTASAAIPVIANHAPTITLKPISGCANESLSLMAGEGQDPDGDVLTYTWSLGDGETGSGMILKHTYVKNGTYRVRVTADDGSGTACGTATAEATATINAPPSATMLIRAEGGKVYVPPAE